MECVVTLDLGSSSARALLFGFDGRQIDGFGSQIAYGPRTTSDGGWEIETEEIVSVAHRALDEICSQMRLRAMRPAAVGVDTFWHSVVGIDHEAQPVTPVLHPFDTRSIEAAKCLARRVDNDAQHSRTGCMIHPSYVPAKLVWLSMTQPGVFRRTERWMSIGEYLLLKFCGQAAASTSMVSATGLWDQNANDYDGEIIEAVGVSREQLTPIDNLDQSCAGAACEWPELRGIPWFPALGDGACDNVGSGCTRRERFSLMVGTSGAMRAIIEADRIEIPRGVFCYRLDTKRFVLGGALSNGGAVYAWMKHTLRLDDNDEILEKQLAALPAGQNGLTVLPLFAGECSTGWRPEARAAIAGLAVDTSPLEILRAALESVALRFREVYGIMESTLGSPQDVIASGGALLRSPLWTQMMADALGRSVLMCPVPEATSRGAALMVLERLGVIKNINSLPPETGSLVHPRTETRDHYTTAFERQRALYKSLFGENA